VATITTFDGDLEEASAPLSIALTLEDELDISRGDLIVEPTRVPQQAAAIEASVVWFDAQRLETHRPYLLKHGAATISARVTRVLRRTNVQTLADEAVNSLGMNDIGMVEIELTRPIFFDAYAENRAMGNFILIDPQSNATLAAGMIRGGLAAETQRHKAALVTFPVGATAAVNRLERALLALDAEVVKTSVTAEITLRGLLALGLLVLVEGAPSRETLSGLAEFVTVETTGFTTTAEIAAKLHEADVIAAKKETTS
jgi:sulfate adenylyltransferase subunit 1 (EFTu-like GTPase family)